MAFESSKNSVVEQLCGTVALPKMVRVRQEFDHTHMEPAEIPNAVWAQLERDAVKQNIKPGMTIAITCGSRGIANIAIIVKAIVDYVKAQGPILSCSPPWAATAALRLRDSWKC